jgi:anti-anti-sigma factor
MTPWRSLDAECSDLLTVELYRVDDLTTIVRPIGEIDLLTAPALERCLAEQVKRNRSVLVDLVGVTLLSCCGLRVLEDAQKRGRRHGATVLVAAPEDHITVRMISFLDSDITMLRSADQLLAWIAANSEAVLGGQEGPDSAA